MLLNQKRVINVFYGVFALLDTETDKNGLYRIVWRYSYYRDRHQQRFSLGCVLNY